MRTGNVCQLLIALTALASGIQLSTASAQGLAGAAVTGTVISRDGTPLPNAGITLTNTLMGTARKTTSNSRGHFLFENVQVVGRFSLVATVIGYAPDSIAGITLHVGDHYTALLRPAGLATVTMDTIVTSAADLRDPGSGGPANIVSGDAARNLPLRNRDFMGLLRLSAQASGGVTTSFSGQHSRFNLIQIDGGTASDFSGVDITPGASTGARVISIESIDQLRVFVAPFDVRQGSFSGAVISAVTRSGSNRLSGALVTSLATEQLVGRDSDGARSVDFRTLQYAGSLGGPLIHDKLHFFVSADIQSSVTPFVGPDVKSPATGISDSTARRAAGAFREIYQFDAGGPEAPALGNPTWSAFAKLTWQPSLGHWFELSQSIVNARRDNLNRLVRNRPDRDGWQLSGSGNETNSHTTTTRLRATSTFGIATNEFMAGASSLTTENASRHRVPLFLVQGDVTGNFLAGGSVKAAQNSATDQNVLEISDNLSLHAGRHLLTIGTQNVFLKFHDNFFLGSWGTWTFAGVEELENGQPARYEVALPLRPGGPLADYSASLLAGYLQDRWSVTARLSITAGVRVDVPHSDAPQRNPILAASEQLSNISTSAFPSGLATVSPRVGFSYTIGNDAAWQLRGGAGVFSGHPPYVWLTNAFTNTGLDQTILICNPADGVPAPTTAIDQLPATCVTNQSPASAVPIVNFVTRDFRFQQAGKFALGLDRKIGRSLTLSLDAVHTVTRNTMFVADVNIFNRGLSAEGRHLYGSIVSNGAARPTRLDSVNFGKVIRLSNVSGETSTSLGVSLEKNWASGALLQLSYNWSTTRDVMSVAGFSGILLFQNNPIDGSIEKRNLRRSARDIPHTFVATAVVPAWWGSTVAFFLRARSGTPFAYAVGGDANADGTASNDLFYVPVNAADISLRNPEMFDELDSYIEAAACTRSQRGRVMQRNSCRNPAAFSLDARLAKELLRVRGRSVEVNADVFNLPNLINRDWGLVREATTTERLELLTVAGWDAVSNRPVYTVPALAGQALLPDHRAIVREDSRWKMQIGLRWRF